MNFWINQILATYYLEKYVPAILPNSLLCIVKKKVMNIKDAYIYVWIYIKVININIKE